MPVACGHEEITTAIEERLAELQEAADAHAAARVNAGNVFKVPRNPKAAPVASSRFLVRIETGWTKVPCEPDCPMCRAEAQHSCGCPSLQLVPAPCTCVRAVEFPTSPGDFAALGLPAPDHVWAAESAPLPMSNTRPIQVSLYASSNEIAAAMRAAGWDVRSWSLVDPPVDPLDAMIDGRSLRWCVEIYARYQREDLTLLVRKAPNEWDIDLTPAQLVAAKAHWSAQLRAKVAASEAARRERAVSLSGWDPYGEESAW